MQTLKRILLQLAILAAIGIVLYFFPQVMKQLFTVYIPLLGILIAVAVVITILFWRHKSNR